MLLYCTVRGDFVEALGSDQESDLWEIVSATFTVSLIDESTRKLDSQS
jgi:hypothetical protein